jgi:octanoyl-[GcvH]:protein N-octanoyltransferase
VEILVAGPFYDPEDGFGLQQAVLEEVAAQERGPAALMWTSSRYIGATRQETRLPGFTAATEAASGLGFPVLVRNSGGGAVAANRGSVSFSLTFPVEDLRHGLYERYSEGLDLIASALRRSGVEAEGGEVEGEFCPGAYSALAARGASNTPGSHKGSRAGPRASKPSFWSPRRMRSGPCWSASTVSWDYRSVQRA